MEWILCRVVESSCFLTRNIAPHILCMTCHFGSSHFGSSHLLLAQCGRLFRVVFSFASLSDDVSCLAKDGLHETPAGWYQVIRGPRPKAAPGQWRSSSSWWHCGQWPVAKSEKPQVQGRWQRGQGPRGGLNPDEDWRVPSKFCGTTILQKHGGCRLLFRSDRLPSRSKSVKLSSNVSQNRLLKMEQERVAEQKELDAALVRLTRLREEMSKVPAPGPTQPASVQPVPPDSTLAELDQLRARVAEMETEREDRCPSLHPTCPGASQRPH